MRKQSQIYRGSRIQQQFNPTNYSFSNLDQDEIQNFINLFVKEDIQKQQYITQAQLERIIATKFTIDNKIRDRLKQEIQVRQYSQIDIQAMLNIISLVKEILKQNKREEGQREYIDAFVALGGQPDLTGTVSRQTIRDIVQNEFDLTIDMAHFLEKLNILEEDLDFQTFCQVFENEERAFSRAGSFASLHSARSKQPQGDSNFFGLENLGKKDDEEFKTLKIRYRDFEKYYDEFLEQERREQEDDEDDRHRGQNINYSNNDSHYD